MGSSSAATTSNVTSTTSLVDSMNRTSNWAQNTTTTDAYNVTNSNNTARTTYNVTSIGNEGGTSIPGAPGLADLMPSGENKWLWLGGLVVAALGLIFFLRRH